ncbi:hypothetical protein [Streptomyces carpaticus]|uniref:Uncharacterized protein n=1 Tax=Streptomyces carpaticus TaxID=285558 RepID=A0ABV4ZUT6_9ACTN
MAREAVAAALAVRGLADDATVVTAGPVRDGHITADRSGTDRITAGPVRGLGDGRPRPMPEDQPLW